MKKVAIGCDEWYPWHYISDYDDRCHSSEWYAVLTISDEDYLVYMGLQEQIERLQAKLGRLYDKNRVKTNLNSSKSSLNSSGDALPSTEAF